jgi:hypothetical protein
MNRGVVWHEKGDDDHRRLQRRHPPRSELCTAYNNRGVAWQAKGDTARANADFDKAKSLGN